MHEVYPSSIFASLPERLSPHCLCLPHWQIEYLSRYLVGPSGLEPPTSCLSGTRSNLLSYEPMWLVSDFCHYLVCVRSPLKIAHGPCPFATLFGLFARLWLPALPVMGFGRGANCAPWSLAVTTIHRIVALCRSLFESLRIKEP